MAPCTVLGSRHARCCLDPASWEPRVRVSQIFFQIHKYTLWKCFIFSRLGLAESIIRKNNSSDNNITVRQLETHKEPRRRPF